MQRSLVAILLFCSFAFQLVLGGGGAACDIAIGIHGHTRSSQATQVMREGADSAARTIGTEAHQHQHGRPSEGALPLPCDLPANTCAVTFVAAVDADSPLAVPATVAARVATMLEPHSRSQGPEPPPPRA